MTNYIADVPFTAFEEVSNESSVSVSEKDIVSEETKFVFNGEDGGYSLEINFAIDLSEGYDSYYGVDNSSGFTKSSIEKLVSRYSVEVNHFKYNGFVGRLSIQDISLPESADSKGLIRGTISALFLPWPKHYPNKLSPRPGEISIYGSGGYGEGFYGKAYIFAEGEYGANTYGDGVYGE